MGTHHAKVSTYFHRTTEAGAAAILRKGFRDAKGTYGTTEEHEGVWLSDVPMDSSEGAKGDSLLVVEIDSVYIKKEHEWVEKGRCYREYLVRAAILNRHAKVRRATEEDEQRGDEKRNQRRQKVLRRLYGKGAAAATWTLNARDDQKTARNTRRAP